MSEKFQSRINHFFNSFQQRTGCSLSEIGEKLGVSAESVKKYKHAPENKVLTSYLTLSAIAQLQGMSAADFCNYLENKKNSKKLSPWQETLIARFAEVSHTYRQQFIHRFLFHASASEVKEMVKMIIKISTLSQSDKKTLNLFLKGWGSKK